VKNNKNYFTVEEIVVEVLVVGGGLGETNKMK
jgi:hypothetical protein